MCRLCKHKSNLTIIVLVLFVGCLLYLSGLQNNDGLRLRMLDRNGPLAFLSGKDKQARQKPVLTILNTSTVSTYRFRHVTEQRAATLKSRCKQYQDTIRNTTSDDEKRFLKRVIVNTSLELMFCPIPKVASSNFRWMLLGMFERIGTLSPLEVSASALYHKYIWRFTYLNRFSVGSRRELYRRFSKVVFVRDPLERLISAFHSKFHSPSFTNRQYFTGIVKRFYARNRRLLQGRAYLRDFEKKRLSFKEFLKYLTDLQELGERPDSHFAPFYALCNPCDAGYDYVGKYHTLIPDMTYIFRQLGKNASFPPRDNTKTFRSSASYVNEYMKEIPIDVRQKLWNIYMMDYILFDYEVPTWLQLDGNSRSEA